MNLGSALLMFAAVSALTSPNDYIFAPFRSKADAAYWIEGRIMGASGDYRILRAEDVAYIDEAWAERRCLFDGSMPPAGTYNIISNRVLRKESFTVTYGRWATVPGYVREGPTLQSGIYRIENGAQLNTRIAKLGGEWCTLSNVYWRVNYSNELTNPIALTNIVKNYQLLALAGKMEREGLNRTDRVSGGNGHYKSDYVNYSQEGYPYEYDWSEYATNDEYDSPWSGDDEYICSVSAYKTAEVGSVRTGDGWEYDLSPDESYYSFSERIHTGETARVTYNLGISSAVVTTGGVQRIQAIKLYVPLSVSYYRSRYKYLAAGYTQIINTNITARFVYAADAALVVTGANAKAVFDLNGKSVATSCVSALGMLQPYELAVNQLDSPTMYVDEYGSYRSTEDNEQRSVTLSISGSAIAILTCTFKTAPP